MKKRYVVCLMDVT